MPGYQSASITTQTQTRDGQAVDWKIDYDARTVMPVVNGQPLGIYKSRSAAKLDLDLVDVQATPGRNEARRLAEIAERKVGGA